MGIALEILEWFDEAGDTIAQRIPATGSTDIKMGAQCIVRESQSAIFFRGGKALDALGPGTHTLTTLNLPLITKALSLPFGFKSPFRAEVYFVNQKVYTKLGWGTKEPIPFRDQECGLVRLRAFGRFTMRVSAPLLFLNQLVGTKSSYTRDDAQEYLRDVIVARLIDLLGENLDSVFNLAAMYDEVAAGVKVRVKDDFAKYGMELMDFFIGAITPPEEVQKMIDERSAVGLMGSVGNQQMNQYMKFKSMQALSDAAKQEGGTLGAGLGLGAGMGMGMIMPKMIMQGGQQAGPAQGGGAAPQQAPQQQGVACASCQTVNPASSKFCSNCGQAIILPGQKACSGCKTMNPEAAKFCSNCGNQFASAGGNCPKCKTEYTTGTKFCSNCGEKLG